ncbi:methionine gamma-lyase family protein [bacterium]|nr:methionine gamma-lyase family protein [bacterium]
MRERLLREGLQAQQIENFFEATRLTRDLREQIRERSHRLQWKVLDALQGRGLSEVHLLGSTGYGYGDTGRELLDEIYADLFDCESALVRLQFVSGTHAIACGLFGNLRPGQEMVSLSGEPYDTLSTVIGQKSDSPGSLKEWGVSYRQLDLRDDRLDLEAIQTFLRPETALVFLQRSRGYAWRSSLTVEQLGEAIRRARKVCPHAVIMVDNCYGELVEEQEPTHVGADLVAGSLIKNLGGTLAATGGYLAGTTRAVAAASYRLTAPGIGAEQGASLGFSRTMLQGLFQAPVVVGQALEGACWAACFLELEGFEVAPRWDGPRTDIVQAIRLGSPEAQAAFCKGVQSSGPVDSKATPESWVQPGYRDPILMAGGTFIAGSSLEMSADCPVRPPYIAYLQGGISLGHVQLGVVRGLVSLKNLVK